MTRFECQMYVIPDLFCVIFFHNLQSRLSRKVKFKKKCHQKTTIVYLSNYTFMLSDVNYELLYQKYDTDYTKIIDIIVIPESTRSVLL